MPFYTPGTEKFVSEPGNRFVQQFSPVVHDDGTVELVEDGVFDLYEKIQQDAEANSIPALLRRYENGDLTAFSGHPMYGDFTDMPKTYAEFLQAQINANRLWEQLPVVIKQRFDMDKDQFFAQAGSEDWLKKVDPKYGVDVSVSEKESDVSEP